jgi:ribonuclease P protein component
VVHFLAPERVDGDPMSAEPPARFGFVVSKAVGGAVVRNRVKRRLRHACHGLVTDLPAGSVTVVRALPSAATAGFDQLAADLSSGIGKAKDRVG